MKSMLKIFMVVFIGILVVYHPSLGIAGEWQPKGTITFQVGFGAGGSTDTLTRMVASSIEKQTGWNIIVDNKPGGGGIAMLSGLKHKKPDGLTLGVAVNMPIVITMALGRTKLPFTIDSFDYIGTINNIELGLVAKADAPFNDFAGLLDHVKATANPIGFDAKPQQLVLSAVEKQSGVRLKLVAHKSGAEQIQSLLGGHVVAACLAGEQIKYIESGDLKLIASFNKDRHGYAPEKKTLIESGYDFYLDPMFFVAAPKGLPADIKLALTKAFDTALNSDEVKEALMNTIQMSPNNLGPEGTQKMLEDAVKDMSKVVTLGVK